MFDHLRSKVVKNLPEFRQLANENEEAVNQLLNARGEMAEMQRLLYQAEVERDAALSERMRAVSAQLAAEKLAAESEKNQETVTLKMEEMRQAVVAAQETRKSAEEKAEILRDRLAALEEREKHLANLLRVKDGEMRKAQESLRSDLEKEQEERERLAKDFSVLEEKAGVLHRALCKAEEEKEKLAREYAASSEKSTSLAREIQEAQRALQEKASKEEALERRIIAVAEAAALAVPSVLEAQEPPQEKSLDTMSYVELAATRLIKSAPQEGEGFKRLVFMHIPRTGGSNFWHSVANGYANNNDVINFLDLYHLTRQPGGLLYELDALRENKKVIEEIGTHLLIHSHRVNSPIWRDLPKHSRIFTILRDPLERTISHINHIIGLCVEPAETRDGKVTKVKAVDHVLQFYQIYPVFCQRPSESIPGFGNTQVVMQMIYLNNDNPVFDVQWIKDNSEKIVTRILEKFPLFRNFLSYYFLEYFGMLQFCGMDELYKLERLLRKRFPGDEWLDRLTTLIGQHFDKIFLSPDDALAWLGQETGLAPMKSGELPNSSKHYVEIKTKALKDTYRDLMTSDYYLYEKLKRIGG